MTTIDKMLAWHEQVASVCGQLSLAISRRRVGRRQVLELADNLRLTADAMAAWAKQEEKANDA